MWLPLLDVPWVPCVDVSWRACCVSLCWRVACARGLDTTVDTRAQMTESHRCILYMGGRVYRTPL